MINIIVAIAQNRAIGYQNELIYWLPDDLKRFKQLTTGHTVIMGRKTFESLPKGALPNRRNIVLSTDPHASFPGAETFNSLSKALGAIHEAEEVFLIGGAAVYKKGVEIADMIRLTQVENIPENADTFFPEIDPAEWEEVSREAHSVDEKHPYPYTFIDYKRRKR